MSEDLINCRGNASPGFRLYPRFSIRNGEREGERGKRGERERDRGGRTDGGGRIRVATIATNWLAAVALRQI